MKPITIHSLFFILFLFFLTGCRHSVKELEDKIYSRHLQRHVALTIISTAMPNEKSDMNLLLFNNADELEKIQAKKIIDSLYDKNLIEPLELVAIDGKDEEYGLSDLADAYSDKNGKKADKYNSFVINELLPFIKKRSKIRKFKSITICGGSLAGISAFDIAWHNADKIDKVGIFSGDFMHAGDQTVDSGSMNAVFESLKLSRKRPKLQYWFYATDSNDSSILKNTKEFIEILNKKNTVSSDGIQFISDKTGNNDFISWRKNFAGFLLWAYGK